MEDAVIAMRVSQTILWQAHSMINRSRASVMFQQLAGPGKDFIHKAEKEGP